MWLSQFHKKYLLIPQIYFWAIHFSLILAHFQGINSYILRFYNQSIFEAYKLYCRRHKQSESFYNLFIIWRDGHIWTVFTSWIHDIFKKICRDCLGSWDFGTMRLGDHFILRTWNEGTVDFVWLLIAFVWKHHDTKQLFRKFVHIFQNNPFLPLQNYTSIWLNKNYNNINNNNCSYNNWFERSECTRGANWVAHYFWSLIFFFSFLSPLLKSQKGLS